MKEATAGPAADRVARLRVEGGHVVAYVCGERHAETVLCINGGPGLPSRREVEAAYTSTSIPSR